MSKDIKIASLHWFKSYGNFTDWWDFAYWWNFIGFAPAAWASGLLLDDEKAMMFNNVRVARQQQSVALVFQGQHGAVQPQQEVYVLFLQSINVFF